MLDRIKLRTAVLGMGMALLVSFAEATEVAGVKFDDTAIVANQELKLNGAGIRHKFIVKVYVAGLYLPERKNTLTDILALPGSKRITLTLLRDIDPDTLGQAFMDGIKKNSDMNERARIIGQMTTFGNLFATVPELKKGDVLTVDWIPGGGTACSLNGKKVGDSIPDVAFYNALVKIWLGSKPADESLKAAMLGAKP
ncbi:MAG: chalcone isomerase family protein [Burkholderiaceae bacterium]|nr:chalcone isomerase family protein [Burkholderiaceae bacterium]